MKKLSFVVDIGYRKFRFADGDVALEFAVTAAQTVITEERVEIAIEVENDDDVC